MKSRILLLLAILLPSNLALAKDYEQDPFHDNDFIEKPTLLNKAHATQKRLEIGVDFTTSMVEKYTSHKGVIGTLGWHFHDTFALELYGGYMVGKYNGLFNALKGKLEEDKITNRDPTLPSLQQMTWLADAVLLWTPIYGKLNFVSELAISGNIYFLLGAGANGVRTVNNFDNSIDKGVKFNFQWGIGGRLYLTNWMAIRLEFRDIDYIGTWQKNPSNPHTSGIPDYKYVTMNHMFHVGLSFFPF